VNPIDPDRRELDTDELRKFIRESKDLGVYIYFMLGGEPLIRTDLLDLLAGEKDAFFMIFTNATLLVDDGIAATISKRPNILPMLSIEGSREATDRWRGPRHVRQGDERDGAASPAWRVLRLFDHCHQPTIAKKYLRNLLWARCTPPAAASPTIPATSPSAEGAPRQYQLSVKARWALREAVSKLAAKYDIAFISENLEEACIGGSEYLHISPYGDAEPCPAIHHSTHNIRQHSLVEIMKSRIMQEMREAAEALSGAAESCVFRKRQVPPIVRSGQRMWGMSGRDRYALPRQRGDDRRTVSLTRTTIGIMLFVGLLYYRPLIWFVAVMQIIAGLTGICLLDKLYRRLLGKDFGKKKSADGEVTEIGGACI